ncbi:Fanconi anemia group J protein-like isoform X2 [Oscarella lobularis]
MMAKIIQSIEKRQNSLLESPTGSGKSLALLCSVLAWQAAEKEKAMKAATVELSAPEGNCTCQKMAPPHSAVSLSHPPSAAPAMSPMLLVPVQFNPAVASSTPSPALSQSPDSIGAIVADTTKCKITEKPIVHQKIQYEEDASDFTQRSRAIFVPVQGIIPPKGGIQFSSQQQQNGASPAVLPAAQPLSIPQALHPSPSSPPLQSKCDYCVSLMEYQDQLIRNSRQKKKIRYPKIYFGTRTHKQIAQIVRELRKTAYNDVKMCILGSREHTCIHPAVSRSRQKNDDCRRLTQSNSCNYMKNLRIRTFQDMEDNGFDSIWDIEELVSFGKEKKMCPYFISRNLLDQADIIFCPYNYLIDPKIRFQMKLHLEEQIVILDEAHNIEDTSRDAASGVFTDEQLRDVLQDLNQMTTAEILKESHEHMKLMCDPFLQWIQSNQGRLVQHSFVNYYKTIDGNEMLAYLKSKGIVPSSLSVFGSHFEKVASHSLEPQRQATLTMKTATITILESLFLLLGFLMDHDARYAQDYRIAAGRTLLHGDDENSGRRSFGSRRSGGGGDRYTVHSVNFWCLNPAVVFSYMSSLCRCIVLSSGTLSPMDTFASELGTPFPISLEANHVIKKSQVWVGTVALGPNQVALDGRFQTSETYRYQDEVGQIVLSVCKAVPHGVLCFVPSYSHIEKFVSRWGDTGVLSEMGRAKNMFKEPRGGPKADFDDILHTFYDTIRESEKGALLFAVCRGKVSEGLDFADNNARAVITVGIPYPNWKDVQVQEKRSYNDKHSAKRGLLSGSQWYEIQAFRALNQALGRCLRHKQDWGALVMIDERFRKNPRYVNSLSKWIRQYVHHFELFNDALTSLVEFSKDRVANALPSDTSFNSSTLVKSESTLPIDKSSPVCETKTDAIARLKSEDLASPSTLFSQLTMNERTMAESTEPLFQSSPQLDDHSYVRVISARKREQLSSSQVDEEEEEEDCARKRAAIARPVEEEKKESIAHEKSALVCRKCGACIAKDDCAELDKDASSFWSVFQNYSDGLWVSNGDCFSEHCVRYPANQSGFPFPTFVTGECNGVTFVLLCCRNCVNNGSGSAACAPVGVKVVASEQGNFGGKVLFFANVVQKLYIK